MSNRANPENYKSRKMAEQEYFAQKEKKKHLPDNPKMIVESPRSYKLCKTCNLKPRANGSARCSQCSSTYKLKQPV